MNHSHHYRFLIIIIFFVLAILTSVLIYSKAINSPIITGSLMTKVQKTPTPAKPTFGTLTIKNSDDTTRHPVTDYLKLDIFADANQIDVVGYDIIIKFDTKSLEVIQIDSVLSDFNLFKMKGENKLTITATKKLDATGTNLLTNKKIVTLTLKPQKTGKFNFQLLSDFGREKTQLVDTGSNVYYPKLNNIEIENY